MLYYRQIKILTLYEGKSVPFEIIKCFLKDNEDVINLSKWKSPENCSRVGEHKAQWAEQSTIAHSIVLYFYSNPEDHHINLERQVKQATIPL